MKKIISLLLIIVMLFTIVSCAEELCQHRDRDDDELCDKCDEEYTDGKDVMDDDGDSEENGDSEDNDENDNDNDQTKDSVETEDVDKITDGIQDEDLQTEDSTQTKNDEETEKDLDDNVLVCGVTLMQNMSEKDPNGEWIGFESEFAQEVCKLIGMEVEFLEITWDRKYNELESGTIDCIWNGFTANAQEYKSSGERVKRSELVDLSYGYMLNQQCIVVRKEELAEYSDEASLKGKIACAEGGSAGEWYAELLTGNNGVLSEDSQRKTFIEVKSGACDFAVVDIGFAKDVCGIGDYADLAIVENIEFDAEVYAVAFKKGSDLTEKVNGAIKQLFENGKLLEIAEKYGLEYTLCFVENVDDVKISY